MTDNKVCLLVFRGKKEIVSIEQLQNMETLNKAILLSFPKLSSQYELVYLDQEDDEISITNNNDLQIFKDIYSKTSMI